MVGFRIFNTQIKITFSFFALFAVILLSNKTVFYTLIIALACCILHELGHLTVMYMCSQKPEEIVFYAGGIKIKKSDRILACKQEIAVLSAGSVLNILLGFITLRIAHSFTSFAIANLFLGLFNLMPVKHFDGGRILSIMLGDRWLAKAVRIVFIISFLFVIVQMLLKGIFNISLFLTFVYIIISEFFT